MYVRILATLVMLVFSATLSAQFADSYQVRYAANLTRGDSIVNVTNAGSHNVGPADPSWICVNVYVWDPGEQPIACCTCPLSPNELRSFSVRNDLIVNPLLVQSIRTSVSIKLVATLPIGGVNANGASCDATQALPYATGLRAWGTTLHLAPNGQYVVTETEFANASLSTSEANRLRNTCAFARQFGSGGGICRTCSIGARAPGTQQ